MSNEIGHNLKYFLLYMQSIVHYWVLTWHKTPQNRRDNVVFGLPQGPEEYALAWQYGTEYYCRSVIPDVKVDRSRVRPWFPRPCDFVGERVVMLQWRLFISIILDTSYDCQVRVSLSTLILPGQLYLQSVLVLCDTWNRSDDNDTVSGIAILDTTAIPEMRYAISSFSEIASLILK